jgi:DNA-binding IscR family transcriptional regulator
MSAVWDRDDLSSTQKLVLLALADWANDEGLCWPSISRLAEKASLTGRAVQKTIRGLEELQFIRRDEVIGKGNRYWILIPLNNIHPCTTFTPPLNVVHPTPERGSDNTSIKHQDTPIDKGGALPDWIPLEAWEGWLEMRAIRKKPMTDRATTRAINKLDVMRQAGQDIAEVLDRSTLNGWTDLYEIKENGNGNGHRTTSNDRRSSLARAIDEGIDFLG